MFYGVKFVSFSCQSDISETFYFILLKSCCVYAHLQKRYCRQQRKGYHSTSSCEKIYFNV